MLNLFRKLRNKLLLKGRISRYLFYAVGEIFLVVLGILIALGINNWNEENKTKENARSVLTALHDDLLQDIKIIEERMEEVNFQYQLNESMRSRVAAEDATIDTLVHIARREYNPNWNNPIVYNLNAYNNLQQQNLLEFLPDSLEVAIKTFYNIKSNQLAQIEKLTVAYQDKVSSYVDTYTFGSTELHDQGPLIDSLVWVEVDHRHLAAAFQGMSNFKRIIFRLTKEEMEFSQKNSRSLANQINYYLKNE